MVDVLHIPEGMCTTAKTSPAKSRTGMKKFFAAVRKDVVVVRSGT